MNDFIVWYSNDINEDKFSQEFTLDQLIKQDHLDYISDSKILVSYKVDSINRGIGLKDINGKNIYADSSIVEFDYKYLSGLVEKCIGCFIYDKEDLLYTIKLIGTPSKNCIDYLKSSMKNFKIIDTIQENKLGLIK